MRSIPLHSDLMEHAAQIVLQKQVEAVISSSQISDTSHLHFVCDRTANIGHSEWWT